MKQRGDAGLVFDARRVLVRIYRDVVAMVQISQPSSGQQHPEKTTSKWYGPNIVSLAVLLVIVPISVPSERRQAYPHVSTRLLPSVITMCVVERTGVRRHICCSDEEPLSRHIGNLKPYRHSPGALPPIDSLPDFRVRVVDQPVNFYIAITQAEKVRLASLEPSKRKVSSFLTRRHELRQRRIYLARQDRSIVPHSGQLRPSTSKRPKR
jgi:hypothetical protein